MIFLNCFLRVYLTAIQKRFYLYTSEECFAVNLFALEKFTLNYSRVFFLTQLLAWCTLHTDVDVQLLFSETNEITHKNHKNVLYGDSSVARCAQASHFTSVFA